MYNTYKSNKRKGLMKDKAYYREKLKEVMAGRYLSKADVCKEAGIVYATLRKFFDDQPITLLSMRKIRDFVERYWIDEVV